MLCHSHSFTSCVVLSGMRGTVTENGPISVHFETLACTILAVSVVANSSINLFVIYLFFFHLLFFLRLFCCLSSLNMKKSVFPVSFSFLNLSLNYRVRRNCTLSQCRAIQNKIHTVNKKTINLKTFSHGRSSTRNVARGSCSIHIRQTSSEVGFAFDKIHYVCTRCCR